eukprot:Polyplicarium_translucidae@DN3261_c0_g2_i1.p1
MRFARLRRPALDKSPSDEASGGGARFLGIGSAARSDGCGEIPNLCDEPIVVYFNPNAAFYELPTWEQELSKLYLKNGAHLVVFNYRGFGRSSGRPSPGGVARDADDLLRFLRSRIGASCLGLHGRSIGGIPAAFAASRHQDAVRWLLLDRTFASISTVAEMMMGRWTWPLLSLWGFHHDNVEDYMLAQRCYKVLCCDGRDNIVHNLASLKAGIARAANGGRAQSVRWMASRCQDDGKGIVSAAIGKASNVFRRARSPGARDLQGVEMGRAADDSRPTALVGNDVHDWRRRLAEAVAFPLTISVLTEEQCARFVSAWDFVSSCCFLCTAWYTERQVPHQLAASLLRTLGERRMTEGDVQSLMSTLARCDAPLRRTIVPLACGLRAGGQTMESALLVKEMHALEYTGRVPDSGFRYRVAALRSFFETMETWGAGGACVPMKDSGIARSLFEASLDSSGCLHDKKDFRTVIAAARTAFCAGCEQFMRQFSAPAETVPAIEEPVAARLIREIRNCLGALEEFIVLLHDELKKKEVDQRGSADASSGLFGHLVPLSCGHNGTFETGDISQLEAHMAKSGLLSGGERTTLCPA